MVLEKYLIVIRYKLLKGKVRTMVKIENDKRFRANDEVWWFDALGNLQNGIVYNVQVGEKPEVTPVVHVRTGKHDNVLMSIEMTKCWSTKEECLRAEQKRITLQTEEYKREIIDTESLIRFMFKHDVCSENKDEEAEEAAKTRAKELLNIIDIFP